MIKASATILVLVALLCLIQKNNAFCVDEIAMCNQHCSGTCNTYYDDSETCCVGIGDFTVCNRDEFVCDVMCGEGCDCEYLEDWGYYCTRKFNVQYYICYDSNDECNSDCGGKCEYSEELHQPCCKDKGGKQKNGKVPYIVGGKN